MHGSFGQAAGGSNTLITEFCFVFEAQRLDELFHWNPVCCVLCAGMLIPSKQRESRLTG